MTARFGKGELAGVRALVVDDDQDLADGIADFLGMCGMEVRVAGSGREGFAAFAADRPDVLVSDIDMADGTGLDLIGRVRALSPEQGGLTPAIAMSGASTPQQCFEAGFHYHFQKPIEPLLLVDTIRDFVRAARVGRAQWSVTVPRDHEVMVRFEGHVTATDMRAAVSRVAELLARSAGGERVTVDLSRLSGFDPSVGAVAQSVVWRLRHHVREAVIVGGSALAHLVARGTCIVLGFPCRVVPASSSAAG